MTVLDLLQDAPPPDFADLETFQRFPGFKRAPAFLQAEILRRRFKRIADVGGGANPMLNEAFIAEHGLTYCVLDISETELRKAPAAYKKLCVDVCAPPDAFREVLPDNSVDIAFSHMFLEHIGDPDAAHSNIRNALRPGGVAVHFYPSPNNIPLFMNKILPQWLTLRMVRWVQPTRDLDGHLGKFPAYYKLCGRSPRFVREHFAALGFNVLIHTGFIGHDYYRRIPGLRALEKRMRRSLVAAGLRWTSFELLMLEKR